MNYEEMKKKVALVKEMEKLYGRELSDYERQILLKEGKDALNESLCIDQEALYIKHDLQSILTLYMTGARDEYEAFLEAVSKKKEGYAKVLRDIADDLDPQCYDDCDIDKEDAVIDLLLAGEELELTDEEIDEVIDELEDRFDSYMLAVNDGKVTVKVK